MAARTVLFPKSSNKLKLPERCARVVDYGLMLGRLLDERGVPKDAEPLARFHPTHGQVLDEAFGGGWMLGEGPLDQEEGVAEQVDWAVLATPAHGIVTSLQVSLDVPSLQIVSHRQPRPIAFEELMRNEDDMRYGRDAFSYEARLFNVRAIGELLAGAVDLHGLRAEFGLTPQPPRPRP